MTVLDHGGGDGDDHELTTIVLLTPIDTRTHCGFIKCTLSTRVLHNTNKNIGPTAQPILSDKRTCQKPFDHETLEHKLIGSKSIIYGPCG